MRIKTIVFIPSHFQNFQSKLISNLLLPSATLNIKHQTRYLPFKLVRTGKIVSRVLEADQGRRPDTSGKYFFSTDLPASKPNACLYIVIV